MQQALRVFLAERAATAMTPRDLDAVHAALIEATRRLGPETVQYLRSTYVPSRQRWFAVFAAGDAQIVHRTVELAQLPTVKVSPAFEMSSQENVPVCRATTEFH